jgi:hypothetical protein
MTSLIVCAAPSDGLVEEVQMPIRRGFVAFVAAARAA